MTCFWDSILRKLTTSDMRDIGETGRPMSAQGLAKMFKRNNKRTTRVIWNDEKPTKKQLKENYDAVKEYKSRSAYNGYYCSTFDPFLFLAAELFKVTIIHEYRGHKIKYKYKHEDEEAKTRIWRFASNSGHFWCGRDSWSSSRRYY